MAEKIYTVAEVAKLKNVSNEAVYSWIRGYKKDNRPKLKASTGFIDGKTCTVIREDDLKNFFSQRVIIE